MMREKFSTQPSVLARVRAAPGPMALVATSPSASIAWSVPSRGSNEVDARLSLTCSQSTTLPPVPEVFVRYGSTQSEPRRGLGVGRPEDNASQPPAGQVG